MVKPLLSIPALPGGFLFTPLKDPERVMFVKVVWKFHCILMDLLPQTEGSDGVNQQDTRQVGHPQGLLS